MAVTSDVGDPSNVHPKDKEPVGDRLSQIALAKVYAKKLEFSGPVYVGAKMRGTEGIVSFTHAEGLKSEGGPPQWFQVAGADGKYAEATATVRGTTVVVHSNSVPNPMYVRYAWDNYPQGANLVNGTGLPAAPFRTDSSDALSAAAREFSGK
jgi:sialate O-acetylesterase